MLHWAPHFHFAGAMPVPKRAPEHGALMFACPAPFRLAVLDSNRGMRVGEEKSFASAASEITVLTGLSWTRPLPASGLSEDKLTCPWRGSRTFAFSLVRDQYILYLQNIGYQP